MRVKGTGDFGVWGGDGGGGGADVAPLKMHPHTSLTCFVFHKYSQPWIGK